MYLLERAGRLEPPCRVGLRAGNSRREPREPSLGRFEYAMRLSVGGPECQAGSPDATFGPEAKVAERRPVELAALIGIHGLWLPPTTRFWRWSINHLDVDKTAA